jgi:hypothetical protein
MKYVLITLLASALLVGCTQTGKVYSRAEIAARHSATLVERKSSIGATYAEREVVPLRHVGTNRTEVAASLGPAYPVSDRFVPEGGTDEEIHDTFDARWYVTYSDRGQLLKVEKTSIIRDAKANKAIHRTK